jgi:hypothetical protein
MQESNITHSNDNDNAHNEDYDEALTTPPVEEKAERINPRELRNAAAERA